MRPNENLKQATDSTVICGGSRRLEEDSGQQLRIKPLMRKREKELGIGGKTPAVWAMGSKSNCSIFRKSGMLRRRT